MYRAELFRVGMGKCVARRLMAEQSAPLAVGPQERECGLGVETVPQPRQTTTVARKNDRCG